MGKKRYVVQLKQEERTQLNSMIKKGTIAARTLARVHILRLADEGQTDAQIITALGVGHATVERIRKRYVEQGLQAALYEQPRPGAERLLSEKQEAYLIALSCSAPPNHRVKWTMQLLADRLVEAGLVEEISDETVRRTLKKMRSNPGKSSNGASQR